MEGAGDRLIEPSARRRINVARVEEVYEGENGPDMELERALDANRPVIIIEPKALGEQTAHWITAGNCLHKTAVLSGLGAIVSGLVWSDHPLFFSPLLSLSLICTSLYTVAWHCDPCVKYQVEHNSEYLAHIPELSEMPSVVVLVRKDNTRSRVLQCSVVSILATAMFAYRIYQSTK